MTADGATLIHGASSVARIYLTSRQALIAFLFDIGGILAGWIVSLVIPTLEIAPWILIIYPMVLTVRGNIAGIFSGNLSTSLNIGLVKPRFTKNTETYYALIAGVMLVTLVAGLILGAISFLSASLLLNASIGDFILILAVSASVMALSTIITAPINISVGIAAFKFGVDPDVLVYPAMSTVADIVVSCCLALIVNLYIVVLGGNFLSVTLLTLALLIFPLYLSLRRMYVGDEEFIRNVRETIPLIITLLLVSNFTGAFLSQLRRYIEAEPSILIVFPALIDTIGDVGSVIGSMATTRLTIGFLKPNLSDFREMIPELIGASSIAMLLTLVYGLLGGISELSKLFSPSRYLALSLTFILCVPVIIGTAFLTAIYTFKRGWNPDNFVNPIGATLADLVTTVSLTLSIYILGI